jgi:hypothetical protein
MKLEVNFFSLENLKRDLFKKTRHIDNKPFTKEDLQQYDYETLFYNIFFDRNNKNLIIVGPRLGNFKELLFPFEINFNKKLLKKYILIGINPMIFILKFELNSPVLEENHVQVILKNKLSKNFLIKKNNLKVGKNVLVTKQKNNKLIWIEDWIKHYQKIGVNTIVIYDNNSDYQDELIKKYKDDENIYIIPYNFKFGMINCHYHKYMQEALLNDFLYQFCDNNYILNFDIDELLQINLLSEILKPKINMYFYQKQVPVIEDLPQEFSFNNFIVLFAPGIHLKSLIFPI